MDAPVSTLAARSVGIDAGARRLVSNLDLELVAGEFTAILGRNRSGKTLTLHTLAGLRKPQQGAVHIGSNALGGMTRRAAAQRIGLLMQDLEESFVTTALVFLALGAVIGTHALRRSQLCSGGPMRLNPVWSDEHRATVRATGIA